MIHSLFGSQSIVRVLYFLLVNGHCYASELRKQFDSALTPFQNALEQLEREGVLMCELHGKTRLFRFNPGFPLLGELERLLQRAYLLLPHEEKMKYLVEKRSQGNRPLFASEKKKIALSFWGKLQQVKQFTIKAKGDGFVSNGKGEVRLVKEAENRILFSQKGFWIGSNGHSIDFSSQVRWELNRKDSCLLYSQEQRGGMALSGMIPLFPTGKCELRTQENAESEALYRGIFHLDRLAVRLHWRILAEQKNQEIECIYSS
jgi:hypothetical protein